jgi:hypothetical protein
MVDRYTKALLTIIALSLCWIALQLSTPTAAAQRYGQRVLVTGVTAVAASCIVGTMEGGNLMDCVPDDTR